MAKAQRISVIEQAVAPNKPKQPNRLVISIAGVAGGLATGIGLVLLLEVLNKRIRRPVDLVNKLGISAFGVTPLIETRRERRRRRAIRLFSALLATGAVVAALWYVDNHVTPLDLLFERLMKTSGVAGLLGRG